MESGRLASSYKSGIDAFSIGVTDTLKDTLHFACGIPVGKLEAASAGARSLVSTYQPGDSVLSRRIVRARPCASITKENRYVGEGLSVTAGP